jgi:hypothetical protein
MWASTARRRPVIRTPLILAACLGLTCLAISACDQQPEAPNDPEVCWRDVVGKDGKHSFEVISRKVANLDSCAAQIEGLRLQENRDVAGAYQSFFIFADYESVSSASSRKGFRYPIFLPGQRAVIDAGLRKLIEQNHGQAPKANDLAIDKVQ